MVGLFDIVTLPSARRRGVGRRLVTSMLAWARDEGATDGYLQVVATNAPAIALYRQLGFDEAYRYHYRQAA
jgi:ribosomal protein S18 acetylase RimI-like enzyme